LHTVISFSVSDLKFCLLIITRLQLLNAS
jgi:hypothetical protein